MEHYLWLMSHCSNVVEDVLQYVKDIDYYIMQLLCSLRFKNTYQNIDNR